MWHYEHAGFTVHQLPALKDNYVYLVETAGSDALAVVDPADADAVARACETLNRTPTHILNTHHHWDHTDGNVSLKERFDCRVIGAGGSPEIPGLDEAAGESRPVALGSLSARVIEVPGHTLNHLAFLVGDALFCGDTLFGAGCGRLFEGTPEQMRASLRKLAALPPATKVYCAHEYTLINLRFARNADPENETLKKRASRDTRLRREQRPTIPSTIALELETNPFLRVRDEPFRRDYARRHGIGEDEIEVFAHLREARDRY